MKLRDMAASEAFPFDQSVIDEIVERLSRVLVERVVEVIRKEGLSRHAGGEQAWLNAHEVARRLGVSREWVYEHAEELGARRIGSGPRPRLRFPTESLDRPVADEPGSGRRTNEPSDARRRPQGLIPIYDE